MKVLITSIVGPTQRPCVAGGVPRAQGRGGDEDVPGPRGPVFMTLIEKSFGKEVTTRTWDTVAKVAR